MNKQELDFIQNELLSNFDVNLFLKLTDFLTTIATKEINLLKNVSISEIEILQPEKKHAYEVYAIIIENIRQYPQKLLTLTLNERDLLRRVTENLSVLLDKNEKTLHAFNTANKKVMDIFYTIARNKQVQTYGPTGKKNPPISFNSNFSQRG
jgi:hypothetical protein